MSKKRYEWVFENGENEIIDNLAGRYVTISSPELLNEKDEKISDLEAKLAGKEHTITTLIEDHKASQEWYKKQLAEKDKQLEKLKSENHALISDNAYQEADMFEFNSRIEQLQKQLAEKEKQIKKLNNEAQKYFEDAYCNDFQNQDKISFAVEQLEQLRHDIWTNQQDDGYTDMQVDLYDLNDTIDVRIMQLTHQHEDKGE